jgi:hypothetical protein
MEQYHLLGGTAIALVACGSKALGLVAGTGLLAGCNFLQPQNLILDSIQYCSTMPYKDKKANGY